MYQGKHGNANARKGRKRLFKHGRMAAMVLSTLLLLALAIGGTVAWLTEHIHALPCGLRSDGKL